MDQIISFILTSGGGAVITKAVEGALRKLFRKHKKPITAKAEKEIERTAERMVQVATLEDIERYDPKLEAIRYTTTIHTGRYRGAAKKGAPKKVNPAKKAAPKKVVVFKKVARTKMAIKKPGPKKADKRIVSPK